MSQQQYCSGRLPLASGWPFPGRPGRLLWSGSGGSWQDALHEG